MMRRWLPRVLQRSKSGDHGKAGEADPSPTEERGEEWPTAELEERIRDRFWRLRFVRVFGECSFAAPVWSIPSERRGFRRCRCGLCVRLSDEERRVANAGSTGATRRVSPEERVAAVHEPRALVDLCARVAAEAFLYGVFDALEAEYKRGMTPKAKRLWRRLAGKHRWSEERAAWGASPPVSRMKKDVSLFDRERRTEDDRCARFVKSAMDSGFVGRMTRFPEEMRERVLSARPSLRQHPHESWEVVYKEALWARMLGRLAKHVTLSSPWITRGFTAFHLSDPPIAFPEGRGISRVGVADKEGKGCDSEGEVVISAKGFAKAIGMWQDPKLIRSTLRAEGHKTEDRGEMWCEPAQWVPKHDCADGRKAQKAADYLIRAMRSGGESGCGITLAHLTSVNARIGDSWDSWVVGVTPAGNLVGLYFSFDR